MDSYLIVKTVHVISAAILFGTGLGIAHFFFFAHRSNEAEPRKFAARMTVRADFLFTLPAVILQPLSGAWLVWRGGFDWGDRWLVWTYALYLLAGVCWIPVVLIQIRIKHLAERLAAGLPVDQRAYDRLFRWWFVLGLPAFGAVVVIFFLMVAKPTW